ncbi:MAG TPA: SUMF1/EgtB/PvdO family nonheme iron enzyme [Roseiflexaceae bacterium]|nr:SUMF1/EgtB/PvdO family nonheme iron enzyme [Roseiflexaceae bacterium]
MDEQEFVRARQQRLALYRRTIEYLLAQRGQADAFHDLDLDRQLGDVRREIQTIERELRARGIVVEHGGSEMAVGLGHSTSEAQTSSQDFLPLQYQQLYSDHLGALLFTGLGGLDELRVPLADVYVERMLMRDEPGASQAPSAPTFSDLLTAHTARVQLQGDLGSGRTTCMCHIALACVTALSERSTQGSGTLIEWAGPVPLPIYLWMHALDALFDEPEYAYEDASGAAVPRLWLVIEIWLRRLNHSALIPIFRQALEQGRCLVLIDGLDDLPGRRSQHRISDALNEFVAYYANNRFVAATHGVERGETIHLDNFERYTLVPMDRARIDELIERWYRALADASVLSLPANVSERIARLKGLLHGDELIAELSTSPLTLVLWVLTHAQAHPLPEARGLICMRECDLLLRGWEHGVAHSDRLRHLFGLDLSASVAMSLSLLQPLALALQSRPDTGLEQLPAITHEQARQLIEARLVALGVEPGHARGQLIPSLIDWLCSHDLLAQIQPGMYTMPRRRLRQYLAARDLAELPDFSARARALRHDPGWREALAWVAYELAHSPTRWRVDKLVQSLLSPSAPSAGLDVHDLLLAAECVSAIGELPRSVQPVRHELRWRLTTLLGDPRAAIEERVRAGMLLGTLGDPRFEDLLPPLVSIAAGPFWLGSPGQYDDEGPAHRVDLPTFSIGIYPVTNQEYAAFLKDTQYPQPRYWYDARFNNPSCPVVGVTLYDAGKYCAWLQDRLDQAGLLPRNMVVRLPLEAEWEKAASWDSQRQIKRRYPWGDEWSNTRANTVRGRGAWMISPVGCYPGGVSAAGLHDCIGNVWEWTASVYRNYPGAPTKFHEPGSYALRGSSCMSLPTHARCTFRSRLPADYWRYHLGFRIVLGRPLSGLAQS